jgi:long-chain acyl-CoA synthetase
MSVHTISADDRTIARAAARAAEQFPHQSALRSRQSGRWQAQSFAEVGAIVDQLALGLVALGLQPAERVCILADTRPEWTLASLAISRAGGVVVPVYPTSSARECEWVSGDSQARMVICENAAQAAKLASVRQRLPDLQRVIVIDAAGALGEVSLDYVRRAGEYGSVQELERRCDGVLPTDPYTIIYTSGTTGPPKGCVLTHGNGASVGEMVQEIGFVEPGDVTYLFLPLAHSYALTVQLASFDLGTEIVYYAGDLTQLVAELQETRPTYLPSVPRIFEKVHALATAPFTDASRLRELVDLGVQVRRLREHRQPAPAALELAFAQADDAVFSRVRALFGGRLAKAVSGAAPISPEILRFFYACGVPVLEGWGMTETTGVGAVNTHEHLRFGTVGRPLPGVEFRIGPDGEILTRGPNVFAGYWRNPEATREALTTDGWLHTGDLGALDADGYLTITGRSKDIIITAGGKNLTPANLENDLKRSRFISQAVMYGDRRPYPVALITLDPEQILPWAAQRGLPPTLPELITLPEVRALVQSHLDEVNAGYARVEQIKRFALLDHDLSHELGELTPTLKVKRAVIHQRYADIFEALYANPGTVV